MTVFQKTPKVHRLYQPCSLSSRPSASLDNQPGAGGGGCREGGSMPACALLSGEQCLSPSLSYGPELLEKLETL